MNDNRRSHEASSLRTFFDDQLQHLQALLSNLRGYVHGEPHLDEETEIIEGFVEASNKKIRAVNHYGDRLRVRVCALHDHVLRVSGQIPAPVELSKVTFKVEPLVNALFVNTEEIDRLFQCTPETRSYLRDHSHDEVGVIYALLTACKSEKSVLGVGMLGETLVREVPQRVVNFSSHKIHMPCDSDETLTAALKRYLFDNVVALIKQDMASRIAMESLRPSDLSYEARLNSLANPDVYLDVLIEHLNNPADLLSIIKSHFRVNKMGVKMADDDDSQCVNEFDIHEITWSDGTQNVLLKIAYPRGS